MASKLYLGETHSELVRKFNELVDEFKSYLPLSGGTLTGNVLLSNSNAQGSQPNLKWKTINSKTPYVGYCTGSTDGTFMIASIGGTTYTTGLSIGGSSGNLLWKGTQVATKSDIPTALKNPNALKFGSKTYDGSTAQTITASDIGANVTVTPTLTTGKEIASIKVGSTTTKLYAPTGSVSGNYLPLSGGTMTGDITLNGTRKIKTESGTSYIEFEGGDSALYLGAYDHITLDSTNIYINGDQGDSYLTLDSHGVTIKADRTQNGNITLSAKQGVISAIAPANVSGKEQVTAWFNTANGGRVGFGKEATNSGTGIYFDQVSGTRRLNFRASSTAGEMVWEQPESGSCLYYDVGGVQFRGCSSIMFNQFKSAGYLYTDSSGSLKKGTMPTSLKNPKALTFGSKTYDGSTAQTITASDIGANVTVTQKLTSGTEIGSIKVGTTTTKLYAPEGSTGSNDEFVHIKVSSVNNYGANGMKYIYVQVISGELKQGDLIQVCFPQLTSKHNRVNGIKTNERKVNRMKAFKTYTVGALPDCVNAGVSMYKIEIDPEQGIGKVGRGIISSFTPDGKQRKPRTVRVMRPYVDSKGFTRNKQISNSVHIATNSMTEFISVI